MIMRRRLSRRYIENERAKQRRRLCLRYVFFIVMRLSLVWRVAQFIWPYVRVYFR